MPSGTGPAHLKDLYSKHFANPDKMLLFFLSSAMQLNKPKRCFLFERNRRAASRWKIPAIIHYYPSFIKRFLLWNASDCSTDAFHSADIFRTCCREQEISVSAAQEAARQKWKRSVPPRDHWHLIFLSASPELEPNRPSPTTWSSQLK